MRELGELSSDETMRAVGNLVKNNERRMRGANHLITALEVWDEMSDDERRESVEIALNRLTT